VKLQHEVELTYMVPVEKYARKRRIMMESEGSPPKRVWVLGDDLRKPVRRAAAQPNSTSRRMMLLSSTPS
jgi:hypothetical protein